MTSLPAVWFYRFLGKNFVDFIHTFAQLSLRIKKNWTDVKKPAFIAGCIKQKPSYTHTG
jgi:hypothetical protein